jgi:putative ABC transport system permease protein
MGRVTLKGLLAHKLRLALTAIAVMLGVTFIAGTYVLTDTLHGTFDTLVGTIYKNIDFQIRGVAQFPTKDAAAATRNPIPQSLLAAVRKLPGVAAAEGEVSGYAQFIAPNGTLISNNGEPTLGQSFDPNPQVSELRVIEGRPPSAPDDVVMDAATAQKYHFHVGQRVKILSSGATGTFTISGIAQYGTANTLAGVTLAAFTLPTAQRLMQEPGQLDDIDVVTRPGADQAAVERAIDRALPPGVEVVTGKTVLSEGTSSIDQDLSFFSTALLIFALIALFVGAFTIFNTFSTLVGQRTRELALLRAVGATRRQLFRSVLAEAAIVGFLASGIGVGLGVLTALGIEELLRGFGITLPAGPLVFQARTVIVSLAVGVGVTVISALGPARRAVRVPPVAAIRDHQQDAGAPSRRRAVAGAAVALAGMVLLATGLAKPAVSIVGLGAAAIFIGVATLAPTLSRPLGSVIGRPFARILGVAGRLGRQNAMRNPRRTAQTAAALMVGMALVVAMAIFGASASRSATSSFDNAVRADLIVSTAANDEAGSISPALPHTLAAIPGVTASTVVYAGQFEIGQSVEQLKAVSSRGLGSTIILRLVHGSAGSLARGDLLVDSTTASTDHLAIGDPVAVKFALTGPTTMRVGGIYQPNAAIGSYLIGDAFYRTHFAHPTPAAVLLDTNGGSRVEAAVAHAIAPHPGLQVQTTDQFKNSRTAQVNQIVGLVYALLALAVLIALIGIVNTLILSVLERTREIGLLRAVGMRRRQIRTMVRSEAVILAAFGATIGTLLGAGLGVALVSSLRSQGVTTTTVPIADLAAYFVLACALGLGAATWPARRAARLGILDAVAAE